uniref:hypothetical protein n=1 Tax=Agathobacter sp. TaxID=2021311 RepID=UPI00405760E0
MIVDLVWYGFGGKSAAECLKRIEEKTGEMIALLKAGFLPLWNFHEESYFVFMI